jgi:2-keto-4-pentenoate hydratase
MDLAQIDSLDLIVGEPVRLMQTISQAFRNARLSGHALGGYPGAIPETLEASYRIQDLSIAHWPDDVAGWKVGRILGDLAVHHGADRLLGPIFAKSVQYASEDGPTHFCAIPGGFCAVEAEYVFKLGADAPENVAVISDADVLDCVESLHIGVEIAGSPLSTINDLGPCVVISDFGNNMGLIVGAALKDWRDRLNDLSAVMTIDGQEIGSGHVTAFPRGILGSLRFALTNAEARGRPLKKGAYISTGAVTGVHEIKPGQAALADFGADGQIACVCFARA